MKKFTSNQDVVFGDVNLSEERITSIHGESQNPGAGGWPTVRYFNKDTGYGGAPYAKKTSKRMCEELGDQTYMQAFVEEAGKTSLCSALKDGYPGCSDREKGYIEKAMAKGADEQTKQLNRLERMTGKKMSPTAKSWVLARLAILKQLIGGGGGAEL